MEAPGCSQPLCSLRRDVHNHLLKTQIDSIEAAIRQCGLPPEEFKWGSHDGEWVGLLSDTVPAVRHESGYFCAFGESPTEFRDYAPRSFGRVATGDHHILMVPGSETKTVHQGYLSWQQTLGHFREWLRIVARETGRTLADEGPRVLPPPPVQAPDLTPPAGASEPKAEASLAYPGDDVTFKWLWQHVPARKWALLFTAFVAVFGVGAKYGMGRNTSVHDQPTQLAWLPRDLEADVSTLMNPAAQASAIVQVQAVRGSAALTREARIIGVSSDTMYLAAPAKLALLSATPSKPVVRADSADAGIVLLFDIRGMQAKRNWSSVLPADAKLPAGSVEVMLFYRGRDGIDSGRVKVPLFIKPR